MSDTECYSDPEMEFGALSPGCEAFALDTAHAHKHTQQVLPLECFYRAVIQDLVLSRNDSFFNYLFSQIFSRKVKATLDGKPVSYDELRRHLLHLRRTYFTHVSDGVLKFGPCLASASGGGRQGYLAAHTVLASLVPSEAGWTEGVLQHNALVVKDTVEIQWVEGKSGEMRRISRFDRTTARPVSSP